MKGQKFGHRTLIAYALKPEPPQIYLVQITLQMGRPKYAKGVLASDATIALREIRKSSWLYVSTPAGFTQLLARLIYRIFSETMKLSAKLKTAISKFEASVPGLVGCFYFSPKAYILLR
jgi:hypothetical protein